MIIQRNFGFDLNFELVKVKVSWNRRQRWKFLCCVLFCCWLTTVFQRKKWDLKVFRYLVYDFFQQFSKFTHVECTSSSKTCSREMTCSVTNLSETTTSLNFGCKFKREVTKINVSYSSSMFNHFNVQFLRLLSPDGTKQLKKKSIEKLLNWEVSIFAPSPNLQKSSHFSELHGLSRCFPGWFTAALTRL